MQFNLDISSLRHISEYFATLEKDMKLTILSQNIYLQSGLSMEVLNVTWALGLTIDSGNETGKFYKIVLTPCAYTVFLILQCADLFKVKILN